MKNIVKILSKIICICAYVCMLSACSKEKTPYREITEVDNASMVQVAIGAEDIVMSTEAGQINDNTNTLCSGCSVEDDDKSPESIIKEEEERLSEMEETENQALPTPAEDMDIFEVTKDNVVENTTIIPAQEKEDDEIPADSIIEEIQSPPIYTYTEISDFLYAKQALNVRDLPSTSGNIIGSLKADEKIEITGQCVETQWYRVIYQGMVGYCSNKYLVSELPIETEALQNVQDTAPADLTQNEVDRVINEINIYWNQDVEIYWDDSTFSKSDKERIALCIAQNVARDIESCCSTDYEKANAAAAYVSNLCNYTPYTSEDPDYRTPYGILVCKAYTCAGTTRAVGLILDQLGIAWVHANENQWTHQWNIITDMDGLGVGWADGMIGLADYGEY